VADAPLREAELDELMARLAIGDRSAFDPLYRALRPRVLRLAQTQLGDGAATDVAQSALLRVFSRASEFVPGRPCMPWFYAIAANEIRAHRRRSARLFLDEASAVRRLVDTNDPEMQLVARELKRSLEVAIECLDQDAANAIRAVLGQAPAPSVPAATLRKRVSRAYAKLRVLLGGQNAR
jgi:RNA polymerase sigma factor (sigma-70 family)